MDLAQSRWQAGHYSAAKCELRFSYARHCSGWDAERIQLLTDAMHRNTTIGSERKTAITFALRPEQYILWTIALKTGVPRPTNWCLANLCSSCSSNELGVTACANTNSDCG